MGVARDVTAHLPVLAAVRERARVAAAAPGTCPAARSAHRRLSRPERLTPFGQGDVTKTKACLPQKVDSLVLGRQIPRKRYPVGFESPRRRQCPLLLRVIKFTQSSSGLF